MSFEHFHALPILLSKQSESSLSTTSVESLTSFACPSFLRFISTCISWSHVINEITMLLFNLFDCIFWESYVLLRCLELFYWFFFLLLLFDHLLHYLVEVVTACHFGESVCRNYRNVGHPFYLIILWPVFLQDDFRCHVKWMHFY